MAQIIFPFRSFNCLTKVASHVKEIPHSSLILQLVSYQGKFSQHLFQEILNLTMQRSFHTLEPLITALQTVIIEWRSVPTIIAH